MFWAVELSNILQQHVRKQLLIGIDDDYNHIGDKIIFKKNHELWISQQNYRQNFCWLVEFVKFVQI